MVDRRRISKRELDQRETCGMGREGCFMYAVYQKQMIGKRRLKKRNGIKKKKRGRKKDEWSRLKERIRVIYMHTRKTSG